MIEINKDNFKAEVLEAKGHVLVEFYRAEGCPNCDKMNPLVDQFAKENPEVKVCKYVCGKDPDEITMQYQFKLFPGIFSFIDGEPVRGFYGLKTPEQMTTVFMKKNDIKANIFDFQELLEQAQGGLEFFRKELDNFNVGTKVPDEKDAPKTDKQIFKDEIVGDAPTNETVIHNDTESANK